MEMCDRCFAWTNVTPFCDGCVHRLAPAAMQLGEHEHARRDRVGAEQPQDMRHAVDDGRDLFRRIFRGRNAIEFLATMFACGLGWRAAPAPSP